MEQYIVGLLWVYHDIMEQNQNYFQNIQTSQRLFAASKASTNTSVL